MSVLGDLEIHVCEFPDTFEVQLVNVTKGQWNVAIVEKKAYSKTEHARRQAYIHANKLCELLECNWKFFPLRKRAKQ